MYLIIQYTHKFSTFQTESRIHPVCASDGEAVKSAFWKADKDGDVSTMGRYGLDTFYTAVVIYGTVGATEQFGYDTMEARFNWSHCWLLNIDAFLAAFLATSKKNKNKKIPQLFSKKALFLLL